MRYDRPSVTSFERKDNKIVLIFNDRNIEIRNYEKNGFSLLLENGQLVQCDVVLNEDRIEISSPNVGSVKTIYYGWADNPYLSVFGKSGLPLLPFKHEIK